VRWLGALVALDSSAGVQGVQWEEDGLTSQPRFIPVHALWSAAGATECGQWIEEGGDRISDKRAQGFSFFPKFSIADFDSTLEKNI
jgi:hypothetical protein